MSASTATAPLQIAGELTIYRATELKPILLGALDGLERGSGIAIDLSQVTEIDTAGVQLLLLAQREAAAAGVDSTFLAPSPAVVQAFALLQLQRHLA